MSRTYLAPEFPFNVTSLNTLLDESRWQNVPLIDGYKVKRSDSYFIHGYACSKVAHKDGFIYMRACFDHFDQAELSFLDHYDEWTNDNGAEFFLLANGHLHQFETNPNGAKCYYVDIKLTKTDDAPIELAAISEPGKWTIVAKVALALLGNPSEMKFNIRINLEHVFKDNFEPSYIEANTPVDGLKLTGTMDAAQCAAAEEEFNAEFYQSLLKTDSFIESDLYRLAAPRTACDFSRVLSAYDAYQATTTASARAAAFLTLRREMCLFESKLIEENPTTDRTYTLADGPLTADFAKPHGTLKLGLYGTNGGPRLNNQCVDNFNDAFKKLRLTYSRLHDIPLTNSGLRLVDTHHIFGNWNDDPSNPDNYFFDATDDYLMNLKSLGTDIVYRLGPSIDHSIKTYFRRPKDFDKFAEICAGIVRHVNCGWGNGHHMNIRYWEIWNEANIGIRMWDGTMEDYYRLYVIVAKRLKAEFPDIKVGGGAFGALRPVWTMPFIYHCLKEQAPMDFFSWHRYGRTPDMFISEPFAARRILDAFGFKDTELHLNEWHYAPGDWNARDPNFRRWLDESPEGMMGRDSAAFNLCTLIRWQDSPLDMSNWYMACSTMFGFRHAYGNLNKNYYSYLAFAKMQDCPNLVATTTIDKDICVMAGHDGNGNAAVIVSAFKHQGTEVTLRLNGVAAPKNLNAKLIDTDNDLADVAVEANGNEITLRKQPGSAVFLLTFAY